jgi:DegV family protein with EDD domain
MGKCKVFTNSSSDLSPQLAKQYNIVVIPDVIIFKNIEYLSYVDINPLELYKMMRESLVLPTTSHPNEYMYADSFRTAEEYDEILCITVTSLMSGSYQAASSTARTLAEEGFKPRIYTYDSRQASYGLSLIVIEAAKEEPRRKSLNIWIRSRKRLASISSCVLWKTQKKVAAWEKSNPWPPPFLEYTLY